MGMALLALAVSSALSPVWRGGFACTRPCLVSPKDGVSTLAGQSSSRGSVLRAWKWQAHADRPRGDIRLGSPRVEMANG